MLLPRTVWELDGISTLPFGPNATGYMGCKYVSEKPLEPGETHTRALRTKAREGPRAFSNPFSAMPGAVEPVKAPATT